MKKITRAALLLMCAAICVSISVSCENKKNDSDSEISLNSVTTPALSEQPEETTPFIPDDSYSYKYENSKIIIRDTDNKELMALNMDIPLNSSMSGEIIRDDYNFDGYTDFSVMYSQENSNDFYYFWLYDKTLHFYVKNDFLSRVASPVFDKTNETVSSFENISETDNTEYLYFWQNGQLRLSTRKMREAVDDGLRFTTYITDEDDKESIQKSFTISSDAAAEMDEFVVSARDVAAAQYNVHNTDFLVEYLGTELIDGVMRHKITCGQAFEVVVTLYPKVGDFSDMLANEHNGSSKLVKVDVNKPAVTVEADIATT